MREWIPIKVSSLALCALLPLLAASLCSCGWAEMSRNKDNLAKLRTGMDKEDVEKIMGPPLVNEIYNTPDVWYYYTNTRWSDGAPTRDECTPVVFDEDGKLLGWGVEYYKTNFEFKLWETKKSP